MKKAVGVFGVPGIGKSTLLRARVTMVPEDCYVTGSDVVKSIIAPATTRDLDSWEPSQQVAVRCESIRRLHQMGAETPGFLLVSGHFPLRNRMTKAIEPILTADDHAFFEALVLVDGAAEFVLQLSEGDSRRRHGQALEEIRQHLEFERTLAVATARAMKVPIHIIDERPLDDRLRQLESFLDDIDSGRP